MEQRDKITLDGITLEYGVETNNEFSDCTYFYYGTEKIKKKKYGFFGPVVFIEKPRILFFIEENIKEPTKSKKWWRKKIRKNLWKIERLNEILTGGMV